MDARRDHLAQDIEPALELVFRGDIRAAADEHLPVDRLGCGDVRRRRQRRIVDRHVAEADQRLPFGARRLADDVFDMGAQGRVLRHEQIADAVMSGRRQRDAVLGQFLAEEAVGDLRKQPGAVAHQRIGADRAAMRQVLQHGEAVADDLVRLDALHVRDEADAAGIVLAARIVEAVERRIFQSSRFRLDGQLRRGRRRWRQLRHRPLLDLRPRGRLVPGTPGCCNSWSSRQAFGPVRRLSDSPGRRSLPHADLRTCGLTTRIPSAAKAGPAHSIRQIQPICFVR